MTATPTHRGIRADTYRIRYASGVRRRQLEDGAVRQSPRITRPVETTDMTLLLGDTAARDAFRAWALVHAHTFFPLDLAHRQGVEVRVVGGATGITYRQRQRTPGAPDWEAQLSAESRPLALSPRDLPFGWPPWARILGSGETGTDGIVRRTTVDQGPPVRQGAPTGAALLRSDRLRVLLDAKNLLPFLQWCFHAAPRRLYVPVAGAPDTYQRRRLLDGLAGLTVRQATRRAGRITWLAELATEGYDHDTIVLPEAPDG